MSVPSPRTRFRPLPLLIGAAALALAIALTVLTGGTFSSRTGYDQAAHEVALSEWWRLWAIPPVETALIAVLLAWLLIRARPGGRWWAVACAALLLAAVCSPVAGLAQGGLLTGHMVQHVAMGGVAPLLALLALPKAAPGAAPRRAWHVILTPGPAFALWVISTATWLAPAVHHQVLLHQIWWIAQQVGFFAFGALLWVPITERITPAPTWFGTGAKAVYMVGVWLVGVTLANIFWFSGTAFYPAHAAAAKAWGLTPLEDQGYAGTVMMLTHCVLAFGAVGVLFFRAQGERSLEQRLTEAGLDADEARWAVRYGDRAAVARSVGVPLKMRAGID
ncbi:MAG: cytochrome c oxidase assembly protein [Thermoleophilia bacterium]